MSLSTSEFTQIFNEILKDIQLRNELGYDCENDYYFPSPLKRKIDLIDKTKYNLLLDFVEELANEYLLDYRNELNSLNTINEFLSAKIDILNKIIETN